MIILGLTGSIGMGKTTAANMFAEAGVPIYSADDAVHRLYSGRAAPLIEAAFPGSVENGSVNREKLSAAVIGKPEALKRLEAIVHPLVREEEEAFRRNAQETGAPLALIDIPLLFETGGDKRVDKIVVVSAPAEVQRTRVLARPGMSEEKLDAILARQTPDAEKRARADFIIDTSGSFDNLRRQINEIIAELSGKPAVTAQ
ncbi:dephospho-CoA kinase [Brucella intermedia]|jgi:dephospho-CoA kinase|uniref:dephospho-CoA kinase n=1 Tax=Brucella TaxID=234 RepID=UPI0007C37A48|nr:MULTISPECIES: dephospho-CoA kinase [Brucella/Ochrobactrum group]PJT21289.1 dephospho-CoA kinase [Ochrobactrum sp. 30A/1000/2015]PJT37300.1 dephospho-CoA kinase [Ochrobactrum sp. 27A/999/2015]PJT42253.1 dephospho-CoA kinase [Ochrobactrum sp. 23A/997/2015]KAB2710702.1 dephospho-CoA kinase [Brucella intermedia]MBA8844527.1 dephospho-CoA kinase [Ochrobactrum sp. RH1CCR137]